MAYTLQEPCDEAVIRSAPCREPCPRSAGRWVLVATILGSSMAFVDGTVVNVALPVLQSELNATVADVQWVVEAYALMLAALLLVGGSLGDHYGRRRIFAIGVIVFAAASVACGLSRDAQQLIFARGVQGVGGALLVPGSLAIISASFGEESRGRAIGTWSGFTAITAAMGPILGGWLVENLSWRWVFYVNIPLAVIVVTILFWRVPESRDEAAGERLDVWGALLATVGLGGVVYGLIESAGHGFGAPRVMGAIAVGVVAFVGFVVVEARSSSPMLPPSLFRSRAFTGANVVTLLLYSALSAALFFLPFNLIQVQGYGPTAAGAAFLPLILTIFIMSRWAGGLVSRYGARPPLVAGPAIAAVGYILLAVPGIGGGYWRTFFPAMTVLGVGMAVSVAPLTTVVMEAVDQNRSGIASGVNNAFSRTAGLVSIAVMGILVLAAFNHSLDERLSELRLPPAAAESVDAQRIRLAALEVPDGLDDTTARRLEIAVKRSFVAGFRLVTLAAAGLALLSAVAAGLTLGGRRLPPPARGAFPPP